MSSILPQQATDASRLVGQGSLRASTLIAAASTRIDELEPVINAFITVDTRAAMRHARKLDASAPGRALDGVPFAVKDQFLTQQMRTTAASGRAHHRNSPLNATSVRRLQEAGGILIGKNNQDEFGLGARGLNSQFGAVRNPWDPARVAGGSSSGSAASVAAGEVYFALGTDSGGSVRIPAAMCGVVGFKPTYGRLSLHGLYGAGWSLDHVAALTRTVTDAARVYEVTAGYDRLDPWSDPEPAGRPSACLDDLDPRSIVVGHLGRWPRELEVHPEISREVERAAESLADSGAKLHPAEMPNVWEDSAHCANVIAGAEQSSRHDLRSAKKVRAYGPRTRELLYLGSLVSARDYLVAQQARHRLGRLLRPLLQRCDVLILPTIPVLTPLVEETADTKSPGDGVSGVRLLTFTALFNLLGLPAISVPSGLDSNGMPIGVQFVGRAGCDARLLQVARAYERTREWSHRWSFGASTAPQQGSHGSATN